MTKEGSFKRAVRQRAQATGLRYTEARAALEKGRASPFARTRPVEFAELRAHLETRYGISITSIAPIDDDPETQSLLRTIAQDERSTLEFFQQACKLLSKPA